MAEQWMTMKAAAKRLAISANKISRWGNRGLIKVKPNPYDRRSRLVDLIEIQDKLSDLNALQDMDDDNINDEE